MKHTDIAKQVRKRTKASPAAVYGPPNQTDVTSYNMGPQGVADYLMQRYGTMNPDQNMDRQKQIRAYQLGANRDKKVAKR